MASHFCPSTPCPMCNGGRAQIAKMAHRYMRDRMGVTADVREDQGANQLWRHMFGFACRVLRARSPQSPIDRKGR